MFVVLGAGDGGVDVWQGLARAGGAVRGLGGGGGGAPAHRQPGQQGEGVIIALVLGWGGYGGGNKYNDTMILTPCSTSVWTHTDTCGGGNASGHDCRKHKYFNFYFNFV